MRHVERWFQRLAGAGIAVGFAVAAVAVARPWAPAAARGFDSEATIYPWWIWVLLLAGLACGAAVALTPIGPAGRGWRLAGAGAAVVAGAEVAGTGIVAAKHWRPAQGMGGYPGDTDRLELLALVVATAGLAVVVIAVAQLFRGGALRRASRPAWPAAHVIVGLAIVGLLPVVIDHSTSNPPDLTTWGAVGLIYAGPWGVTVCLAAWLDRPAALAALAAVVACAVLAAIGPQMQSLIFGAAEEAFVLVAVPVALLAALAARGGPAERFAAGARE